MILSRKFREDAQTWIAINNWPFAAGRPHNKIAMNEKKISFKIINKYIIHYTVEFDRQACIYYSLGTINETLGYIYQQVVSEPAKLPAIKTDSKKVTNMVGTFLNEDSIRSNESVFKRAIGYSYQQIVSVSAQAPAIQAASEKVATTVATFLNRVSDD